MHYNRGMRVLVPILAILIGTTQLASARTRLPGDFYGPREGYTFDVYSEKGQAMEEMVIVPNPEKKDGPVKDVIFDTKLTKELRDRYEERFGFSTIDQIHNLPAPITFYSYELGRSRSFQEEVDEERKFGDYVVRRVVEYHADNYFKNSPSMKPVYELKERVSKVDVKVGKSFKLSAKYSLSGNYLEVKGENPWVDSKIVLEFGEDGLKDEIIVLGKRVASKTYVETLYKNIDGIWRITASQGIAPNLGASLTGSTYTNGTGESDRERLILAGLSWSY